MKHGNSLVGSDYLKLLESQISSALTLGWNFQNANEKEVSGRNSSIFDLHWMGRGNGGKNEKRV